MATPSNTSLQAIQQAYIAYYGRPADTAGLQYWASTLDQNGGDLSSVILSFGTSEESRALYGGTSSTAERIDKIYQQLFNRPAEQAGRDYWAAEIDAGRVTLQSAALQFLKGAQGDDLALVNRKLAAAEKFTETLQSKGMSHAYGASDILSARAYVSQVTKDMSDSAIATHLDSTLALIENASWSSYSVVSNALYSMASSHLDFFEDGALFGGYGRINWNASTDIFLATINNSLLPDSAARLGSSNVNESLYGGVSKGDGNGFLLWGDLDSTYNSPFANMTFIWSVDADFNPQAAINIGTTGGDAPQIYDVTVLSNGKILVVGEQNNVADGWDAYALVLNSDLTVYAQKSFDSPQIRTNEEFERGFELSDGNLLLLGDSGELIKVDQSLNILTSRDIGSYSAEVHALEKGLFMIQNNNSFKILDNNLNVLSYFTSYELDELVQTKPGHFIAYDHNGRFFQLHINVDDPTTPILEIDNAKLLAARSGSGVDVGSFSVNEAGIVTVQSYNNLFSFDIEAKASPNMAADYRLLDIELGVSSSLYKYETLERPDWVASDVSIVTIGTLPSYTLESGLIEQTGLVSI